MILGIHHVALTVKDIGKSSKWYEEKLGFKVTDKYNKDGFKIAILRLGNCLLELFAFGAITQKLPTYRQNLMDDLKVVGVKHFAFQVENLDKFVEGLKSKGVKIENQIESTFFGGRYVFFKDDDGILIEVYQAD